MNADFHYYATYCAAILAGYSHEESLAISYSDCFSSNTFHVFYRNINDIGLIVSK